MGVCKYRYIHSFHPVVEVKARSNQANLAVTLIHEYAHVLLHFDVDSEPERAKREVEAEAVAYIVGRFSSWIRVALRSTWLRGRTRTQR